MNVLSYLYGIIMNLSINAPGHKNNVVDGHNSTDTRSFKEQTELLCKSSIIDS